MAAPGFEDDARIAEAARILDAGGLVAFPTETVYGLGADACDDTAVARIFEVKNRPDFNPLIVHVADRDSASDLVTFVTLADRLAAAFWPGPLTLVLPRAPASPLSRLVSAGLDTAAVRVPAHPLAQRLLRRFGGPIAAPSANRSGSVSPTAAAHVRASLGDAVDMILDGGPCAVGLESTVVDATGARPAILRHGAVTAEMLEAAAGPVDDLAGDLAGDGTGEDTTPRRSPGMTLRHYAPSIPVRLDARDPAPDEALLAFGPDVPEGAAATLNLSHSGDLREAAANLFAHLHALDCPEFRAIAVMPIPRTGLGRAIADRLRRAAAASSG